MGLDFPREAGPNHGLLCAFAPLAAGRHSPLIDIFIVGHAMQMFLVLAFLYLPGVLSGEARRAKTEASRKALVFSGYFKC